MQNGVDMETAHETKDTALTLYTTVKVVPTPNTTDSVSLHPLSGCVQALRWDPAFGEFDILYYDKGVLAVSQGGTVDFTAKSDTLTPAGRDFLPRLLEDRETMLAAFRNVGIHGTELGLFASRLANPLQIRFHDNVPHMNGNVVEMLVQIKNILHTRFHGGPSAESACIVYAR